MESRLVLAMVLGMVTWMSVGTSAQNMTTASTMTASENMTTASTMNMNTASENMTTASTMNMNTASENMTTAPMMTVAPMMNMTTAPMMTVAPMMNMTTAPVMTVAPMMNMTTAPMMTVAPMMNMTTAPVMTVAPMTTTTTTAAPLIFNSTVVTLQDNITRTGCGLVRLCASQPAECDPSVPGSCFFVAAKRTSGQNFAFGLAGESEGYIAATLSTDATLGENDVTYICANDNGKVKFITTVVNNGVLTVTNLPANSVKGVVNGNNIQCTFEATVPDSTNRASSAAFSMAVSTGSFTNGTVGNPSLQLQTQVVDISNPTTNVTNQVNVPTVPPNPVGTPAPTNATAPVVTPDVIVPPLTVVTPLPVTQVPDISNPNTTTAPVVTPDVIVPPLTVVTPLPVTQVPDISNPNTTTAAVLTPNTTVTPLTVVTPLPVTQVPDISNPNTTTAAVLTPNTTVTPLTENINRTGCGTVRLCAADPSDCDPSTSGSCFFFSAKQISGQNFQFALSGQSDGYVSLTLSTDLIQGGNDTTYVCAAVDGSAKFFGALLDNNALTVTTLNVNSVKAVINGGAIQCTFSATVPDSTTRTAMNSMIGGSGSVSSNGDLGILTARVQTPILNLANPVANTTNLVANDTTTTPTVVTVTTAAATTASTTTASTTTASHAATLRNSQFQVLLIVLGALGLVVL